ncbi:hypothetical protein [Dactylosporangium sp. NPDC049140]|uniref:hypothetical protein n=1 Tax=Dactylosporangium sp. NPDC049140 TaxID=3155647 RepID=UPI00340E0D53
MWVEPSEGRGDVEVLIITVTVALAESPWRERAAIALALGRFGAVPTMLRHDEDWGVGVCLATSHGLDDDPSTLALVMEAFRDRRLASFVGTGNRYARLREPGWALFLDQYR